VTRREYVYWTLIAGATVGPWVLGLTVHWWAGLILLGLLHWAYDRLFVPPGAICMGIPFMLPFTSGILYIGWGLIMLLLWLLQVAGFTIQIP
jgi:hypothetical protein